MPIALCSWTQFSSTYVSSAITFIQFCTLKISKVLVRTKGVILWHQSPALIFLWIIKEFSAFSKNEFEKFANPQRGQIQDQNEFASISYMSCDKSQQSGLIHGTIARTRRTESPFDLTWQTSSIYHREISIHQGLLQYLLPAIATSRKILKSLVDKNCRSSCSCSPVRSIARRHQRDKNRHLSLETYQ